MGLAELSARYHKAFNDRDFDVWREVFDEDVELVVDGMTFRGARRSDPADGPPRSRWSMTTRLP